MYKTAVCHCQTSNDLIQRWVNVFKRRGISHVHFESVVENVEKCMLTLQHLLWSRLRWISGTSHRFWYMKDEHMHFQRHLNIVYMIMQAFPWIYENHFHIPGVRCYLKRQPRKGEGLKRFYRWMIRWWNQQLRELSVQSNKFEKKVFRFERKWDIPDFMAGLHQIRCMHCNTTISFPSQGSPKLLGLTQALYQKRLNQSCTEQTQGYVRRLSPLSIVLIPHCSK